MREKLITYVDFLFAGAPHDARTEETKAEILQNTLDKYDDLIDQGKTPEAAYSLAVAGIGDVGELLTRGVVSEDASWAASPAESREKREKIAAKRSLMRTIAVMLYITCLLPPILLSNSHLEDTLGPALMFLLIAIATGLMVFQASLGKNVSHTDRVEQHISRREESFSGKTELKKALNSVVFVVGLAVYFVLSFTTMAWHLTWLIFPICAAISAVVRACLDLRGDK